MFIIQKSEIMRKQMNILYKSFVMTLCMAMIAGIGVARAQDDADAEETEVVRRVIKKTPKKQYPTRTVKGVVKDAATKKAIGGARLQALQLPDYSALTEEDGTFSIDVPLFCDVLIVDVPEYNLQQFTIKGTEGQEIRLLSNEFRSFYTDATTITSERTVHLDQTSSITVEDDMQTLLAGDVRSVQRSALPGQGAFMTIRGINTLNANAQPLYVIDGNIVDMEEERTALHEGYFNNKLAGLDPENVESIRVLKNGTALYGAKGANGVIIIDTKRGHSQATKINLRIYGGTELAPSTMSMMGGTAYKNYLGDLVSTIKDVREGTNGSLSQYAFMDSNPNNYYYPVFNNNTDWQKDLYRTAWTQNYKLSIEGGDDVGMYDLSIGYTSGQSTMKNNDFDRLNLRFNTDIEVFRKLFCGIDINYNQVSYNVLDNGWSESYDMQNIGSVNILGLVQSPMISPYAWYHDNDAGKLALSNDYAGKYASSNTVGKWIQNPFCFPRALDINESLRNPMWILENGYAKNKNYAQLTQVGINASPRWEINKHLTLSDHFGFTLNRNNERYFLPISGATQYQLMDLGMISSVLKSQFTKETTINNDLRIAWGNTYGAHHVMAFAGWRYNNYSYSYTYTRGYNNENDKLPNISKSMQYVNYGGTKDNWIDMTGYLYGEYNYKNRYFAELTVSAQSSSRFGKQTQDGIKLFGVKWGIFPSLQLGWVMSSEPWFKTGKGVQYLKLTAGIDQSGNDGIDYYATRTYWESQQVTENTVGLTLKNIENSSIQWETTTRVNVAAEGSFFNNRLNAGVDFFYSRTTNLLTLKDLDYLAGLGQYWTNDGELKNIGVEGRINAALINTKNWKWELGASVGHYKNEITRLPSSDLIVQKNYKTGAETGRYVGHTNSIYGTDNILTAVGYAAGSFFGWQTAGVFSSDAEAAKAAGGDYLKYPTGIKDDPYRNFQAGDVHFVDQNGDGVIDESDKVVIGDPNPDIYGNIFTSLTYKHLRLDLNFKYSLGNDIFNYQRSMLEAGNTTYNQTTAMQNRWTYDGQVTDVPKACYTESTDWRNNERFSDRWIEDGSYLKLRNVRLTYTVPVRSTWLQGLKIWGEGNNLFCVTRYLGLDPEMSCSNGVLYQGIDTGMLTLGRSFNLGLSINL